MWLGYVKIKHGCYFYGNKLSELHKKFANLGIQ